MEFKVKAAGKTGKIEYLTLAGASGAEIEALLKKQELFPLQIDKVPADFFKIVSLENFKKARFSFNKITYLIEFSRLISLLLKSGMALNEAFEVLSDRGGSGDYFSRVIEELKKAINHGISFSLALSRHPEVFEDLYIKTIASGESSGNLSDVMANLSDYYKKKQALYKKLVSAAIYPAFILVLSTIGVTYLFIKVVPTYTKLFSEMGAELPPISQFVFFFANFISSFYIPLGFLAVAFAFMVSGWLKTSEGKDLSDHYSLRIPIVRAFVEKTYCSIFYRTSGLLIKSGINILNAIDVSSNVITNGVLFGRVKTAVKLIREGNSINFSFEKSGFASDILPKLIKTGEESGTLDQIFANIADTMDGDLDSMTGSFEAIFGPLILIFVLGIFGTVIIAILLPMITAATVVS